MGWVIFIALMLLYAIGLFAFHAVGLVHILPLVAFAVLIIDWDLKRKYRQK